MTTPLLRAAASDVCASTALVAWEPFEQRRALGVVHQFTSGHIDAAAARAMLAVGRENDRSAPSRKGTAILSLTGVLTPNASIFSLLGAGTSLTAFMRELRAAGQDDSITSIVVYTDSPGGFVGMVPETAALMRAVRAKKPVVAVVAGLDASAAYWITSSASSIVATPSASIGSIGVFMLRASVLRQLEHEGIDVEVFSSGRFKTEGLPVTAITDEERRSSTARVDETYTDFVNDVAAGRRKAASAVRGGFGEGRAISAKEALRLGMIDSVGLVEDVITSTVSHGSNVALESSDDEDRARRLRLL